MQQKTENQEPLPPILVYYRFRGQLQPIRNLYCYLELPFLEIHMDYFEEQKKELPPHILQHLRKFKIQSEQLPVLIHNEQIVEGQYPIMSYTCNYFERVHLLGSNIFIRTKLQQLINLYQIKQPQWMTQLFKISSTAFKCKTQQQINNQTALLYDRALNNSKYVKQILQHLDKHQTTNYILGEITLIDFCFFQTCNYMVSLFGRKDRVNQTEMENWNPNNCHFLFKPNAYYLEVATKYRDFIKNSSWYHTHKDYLQNFSVINTNISQQQIIGLRKVWIGDPRTVA